MVGNGARIAVAVSNFQAAYSALQRAEFTREQTEKASQAALVEAHKARDAYRKAHEDLVDVVLGPRPAAGS